MSSWMKALVMSLAICSTAILAACGGGDDDDDTGPAGGPAAPTELAGAVMGDGIHVTWRDNSDDEDEFVLERHSGDGAFAEVVRLPFNSNQHHDAPLNGGTYTYRVAAVNEAGRSDSGEATVEMTE